MTPPAVSRLRLAGRAPELPLALRLADGRGFTLHTLLRVLPGKRLVGIADFAGRTVLAKVFVAAGSARHWARECDGLAALAQQGIPTPALLAAAPLSGGGHAVLTEFLPGADDLGRRWQACARLPAGSATASELLLPAFALLGRLHAHGLVHDDLHLGNFLCAEGRLLLIDGDAVRALSPGRPLAAGLAAANLALLTAQLPSPWDDALAPLLAAWQAGGAGLPCLDPADFARRVAATRAARLADFLAKTRRECSAFEVERTFERFAVVARPAAAALAQLRADPDRVMAGGRCLKAGRTATVVAVDIDGHTRVVKRYNIKNAGHALSRAWRPSRAAHAWTAGLALDFLGIATPAPLAMIEARLGPLRRHAWLVTEYCPGENLLEALRSHVDSGPPPALGAALVGLFTHLVRERITHGDLKASNLLWHAGNIVLIDLDALERHRSAAAFARAWRRDRARFLRNWPAGSALQRWLDAHLPPP